MKKIKMILPLLLLVAVVVDLAVDLAPFFSSHQELLMLMLLIALLLSVFGAIRAWVALQRGFQQIIHDLEKKKKN
jgi:hypothetical protein